MIEDWLNRGTWARPSDKMAVYTEIERDCRWGIRVTLLGDGARVEAIDGPRCSWYKVPPRLSQGVSSPGFFARLFGATFERRLRRAVEEKRGVAQVENLKRGDGREVRR